MPRGRPKKSAAAAATHSAKGPGLAPSLAPRPGIVSTDNEEDTAVTPRRRGRPPKNPKGATPRGRGRPPKRPKAEETAPEAPSGEGYEADVSNLTTIGSEDDADDAVASPSALVGGEDASNATTAGSDVADDVVESPITTRRPRGRPPKKSKSVAFVAAPVKTGRGRGRPPKNTSGGAASSGSKLVVDNNEEPEGFDEPHAVSFSLNNLIGSYAVECPKIEDTWLDDAEGGVCEYTLDISPASDGDEMLAASFNFDTITGTLRLALSKARLESFLLEEQRLEQAAIFPPSSQPTEGDEEGTANGDNENNGNIDADVGAVVGEKRKATDTGKPVKRGRGRPPKKAKVVQAPAPPPPSKIFFVYRCKADLGYGETNFDSRFGTIQPDDNSCKLLNGTFDTMPIINERIDFSASKVNDEPGNEAEPWETEKNTVN